MEPVGGQFRYEAFCDQCQRVVEHLHGSCLKCCPVGFPHRPPIRSPQDRPSGVGTDHGPKRREVA